MTPKCHDWQVRSGSPFHRHFFFNYPLMCLFGSEKKYRICFTSISATAEKASYSRLERDSPSARAISNEIALTQSWLKWESRGRQTIPLVSTVSLGSSPKESCTVVA